MLPEKWYIRWRTEEHFKASIDYFKNLPNLSYFKDYKNTGDIRAITYTGDYNNYNNLEGYTEITLEQFLSEVVNKSNTNNSYEIF